MKLRLVSNKSELADPDFLRDIGNKLRTIAPNIIGTDEYHIERLRAIAEKLEAYQAEERRFKSDAAKLGAPHSLEYDTANPQPRSKK